MAEAQQFVWGGPEAAGVPALRARLQEALAWGAALDAATQAKPTLQALEPLLAWQPPPIDHPGARLHMYSASCHRKLCTAPRVPSHASQLPAAPCQHRHPAHYCIPRCIRCVQAEPAPCAAALERLREAAKQARGWLERAEAPATGVAELRVLEALAAEAGANPSVVQLLPPRVKT